MNDIWDFVPLFIVVIAVVWDSITQYFEIWKLEDRIKTLEQEREVRR